MLRADANAIASGRCEGRAGVYAEACRQTCAGMRCCSLEGLALLTDIMRPAAWFVFSPVWPIPIIETSFCIPL